MPCHGPDYTGPTKEEKERWRLAEEKEAIEYMNNTALLLLEVLELKGERPDIMAIHTRDLKAFEKQMSDYCTEKLCSILGAANDKLVQLILASPHAPYIVAWNAEHKKLDKKREDAKDN